MIEGSLSYLNISAPAEQKVNVQPSEEPVFILNSSQLEAIIQKATESLKTEVSQLQAIVSNLEGQISALVSIELQDVERLALDIAHDRQRLTKLEKLNRNHYNKIDPRSFERCLQLTMVKCWRKTHDKRCTYQNHGFQSY